MTPLPRRGGEKADFHEKWLLFAAFFFAQRKALSIPYYFYRRFKK